MAQINYLEYYILNKIKLIYKRITSITVNQLIVFLIICQVIDGSLTVIGVGKLGISKEGNPMIRALMVHFDPIQVLFLIKASAIILLLLIKDIYDYTIRPLRFLKPSLVVISILYLFAAIIPWFYVILTT